jgi:hypothetical protein
MKKLIINLSEEQFKIIDRKISSDGETNFKEETKSGFAFTLNVIEGNISWLELEMNGKIEIGDVIWKIE